MNCRGKQSNEQRPMIGLLKKSSKLIKHSGFRIMCAPDNLDVHRIWEKWFLYGPIPKKKCSPILSGIHYIYIIYVSMYLCKLTFDEKKRNAYTRAWSR